MVLVAALALSLLQEEMLVAHRDAKGKPTVSKEQWFYIHQVLESKNSDWVLKIIHPKHDLVVRLVSTSFPEPTGEIKIYKRVWSRSQVVEHLRDIGGYDYNHPGYQYAMVSQLNPDEPNFEGPIRMKGLMIYEESKIENNFKLIQYPGKRQSARYVKDYRRHSPITYIRMEAREGRLWLAEISSYVPAE